MQETRISSDSGRSPGVEKDNPSGILAWEIPWTEDPGRLQSMGLQKSQTQLSDKATTTIRERKNIKKGTI